MGTLTYETNPAKWIPLIERNYDCKYVHTGVANHAYLLFRDGQKLFFEPDHFSKGRNKLELIRAASRWNRYVKTGSFHPA